MLILLTILMGCTQQIAQSTIQPPITSQITPTQTPYVPKDQGESCAGSASCFKNYLLNCTENVSAERKTDFAVIDYKITGRVNNFYCKVHVTTHAATVTEQDCQMYNQQDMERGVDVDIKYIEVENCQNSV